VTARRLALGAAGEAQAAAWYEANGYEIVARNWRCRDGEIDLIVRLGQCCE
jgi:putative endonuclease